MGNPMPFERVMGPNQHNKENYGDLLPIARSMKPTLWVRSENLNFGLFPNVPTIKLIIDLYVAAGFAPLKFQ